MASKAKAVKSPTTAKAEMASIGEEQIREMRRFWDGGERQRVLTIVKAADPGPVERDRLYREFPGLDVLLARS